MLASPTSSNNRETINSVKYLRQDIAAFNWDLSCVEPTRSFLFSADSESTVSVLHSGSNILRCTPLLLSCGCNGLFLGSGR